ncbi:hypothetical protein [Methylophilus medardicus]|uniref:Uncharacterized protein n=1 Tax=Methylophilus medardicus TaxID=2588534 RepID=A0A5B8CU89_9PROT|nr:hypothetical protein [Methylophilus medardicus]QDC44475.1 hypothetical protein FIU01_08015 [Methylophilus medardicus]QDC49482.1 hypothetical protein FIU00_08015 [Methylophilus medardicus]QDC53187.1 hypothetical protein FIT99_08015 [Methylophilus medardicus]
MNSSNWRIAVSNANWSVLVRQWHAEATRDGVHDEYQGRQYSILLDRNPGSRMDVSASVNPHQMQSQSRLPAVGRPVMVRGRRPHK